MLKRLACLCSKPPVAAAGPATERAPLPPQLPTSASSGALLPRKVRSLARAVEATERERQHLAEDAAAGNTPARPERPHWSRARGKLNQQLLALSHGDRMPPTQANLTYARLVKATMLLMECWQDKEVTPQNAYLLHALLLMGQHRNRCTAHDGWPSALLIPLIYKPHDSNLGSIRGISTLPAGVASHSIHMVPESYGFYSVVVAHEGTHVAQNNGATAASTEGFNGRPALVNTEQHARSQMLEAARGLSRVLEYSQQDLNKRQLEINKQRYALMPREVQAFGEEAAAQSLLVLDGAYLQKPRFSFRFPLGKVLSLLLRAGKELNDAADDGSSIAHFKPGRHPDLAPQVEQILFSTAQLHEATQSAGWTDEHDEQLKTCVESLAENAAQLEGMPLLTAIASALSNFNAALQRSAGFALQAPAAAPLGNAAVPLSFSVARRNPAAVLAHVMAQARASDLEDQPLALTAAQLAQSFETAKNDSGFSAAVQAFLDSNGQLPRPQAVADTVTRLAAQLIGLDMTGLPADLHPAINLYEAPSTEFERIAGLNAPPELAQGEPEVPFAPVTSHQKRKAVFDPLAWQLHVPQHFFHPSQADRLAPRLAGLAAEMAYTVSATLKHQDAWGYRTSEGLSAAGLWGARMPYHCTPAMVALGLGETWHLVQREVKAGFTAGKAMPRITELSWNTKEVDDPPSPAQALNRRATAYIAAHPRSAAAVLRAVVKETPVKDLGLAWHLGPRAEVKHAAQSGAPGAQAAYETSTLQRWQLPAVAFRRAVIGAAVEVPAAPQVLP